MEIDVCPRWLLARLGTPKQHQNHVALLVSALLALTLLPLAVQIPHFCLMRAVLGIPCPGCGVAHSILAILRLHPFGAWAANPAGAGVVLVFGFQLAARPIAIMVPKASNLISQTSHHISNVALAGLLLVWIYRVI